MIAVFKAPTETEAYMVKGLLENEGIKVFVKSWQVAVHNNIINASEGVWGEICVNESDVAKANEILENYLKKSDS